MSKPNQPQSDFLNRSQFLSEASAELRETFVAVASSISLSEGDILFRQGDDGDALFVVEKGLVEISVVSPEGRKLSLNIIGEGQLFGEIALFDSGPRTATATALKQSLLHRVRRRDLFLELRRSPEIAFDMIRLAGARLRWVSAALEDQTFHPLSVRIAKNLLFLARQMGGATKVITMSQSAFADHVGATREAVAKTLGIWKRNGWIDLERGTIRIRNWPALELIVSASNE
jgi:CRP/FNR family transcriptional regulator, cyclic AMP receptor protein